MTADAPLRSQKTEWLILIPVLLGTALWLPGLSGGSLINGDDPFYAVVNRQIAEGRTNLAMALGWRMPLFHVVGAFSYRWFGGAEFALRLPSLIFALTTVALTFRLGRRLFPTRANIALGGACLLAVSTQVFMFARRVRGIDLCLTTFGLLALLLALGQLRSQDDRLGWPRWCGVGLVLGLGFLTKSIVIVVFGPALLAVWWAASNSLLECTKRAFAVAVGAVLPVLTWFGFVAATADTTQVAAHFGTQVVNRALAAEPLVGQSHDSGLAFYVDAFVTHEGWFAVGCLVALCGVTTIGLLKRHLSLVLLLLLSATVFAVFSVATTRLPHYLLPAYPALALSFAWGLDSITTPLRRPLAGLVLAAVIGTVLLQSPFETLSAWGNADWSPELKAGGMLARQQLGDSGELLVLDQYHAAAAYYFDGPTALVTTRANMADAFQRVGLTEGATYHFVPSEDFAAFWSQRSLDTCLIVTQVAQPDPTILEFLTASGAVQRFERGLLFCRNQVRGAL